MPNWISVKERLPEKSGNYLVYCADTYMTIISYSAVHKAFNTYDSVETPVYVINDVTHWMPLPEPPEEVSA